MRIATTENAQYDHRPLFIDGPQEVLYAPLSLDQLQVTINCK